MMALLLVADEVNWGKLIAFGLFFGFPFLARFLKWLKERAGQGTPAQSAFEADPRSTREAQQRAEVEGEELWRRLARGEVAEPPPMRPAPVPMRSREDEEEEEGLSLESEEEPAPLAVLGEVSEPRGVSAVSLESEAEPLPLSALGQPAALSESAVFAEVPERGFRLRPGELRRALILSEILGPPVGERRLRA
ncbi:MAG: hypothetical protein EXS08_03715 [Planctomycetes bacterium]|nr:hypothetical protein [Planctomycetota bacterium]